jgi:hypothetical protein
MVLTHKERMQKALQYEPVDYLPTQINYTALMGEKMSAHFEIRIDDLPIFLNNHMVRVDLTYEKRTSEDGRTTFDYGALDMTPVIRLFHQHDPLAANKNFDTYSGRTT